MPAIVRFEDIIAWQRAQEFAVVVYDLFRANKDYSFKDQIDRAVISISNNIAEGYERRSNNEFRQFLYIAKGSCGEARSMLYIAKRLGYASQSQFDKLQDEGMQISKMLSGLIKTL